jgi:signal transduction histidine kinase
MKNFIGRFYRFRAAYSISTDLLDAIDLKDCLRIFVNRVASYMSVEIVSVMFMDEKKRQLVVKMAKGLGEDAVREPASGIDRSIAGWVARTGLPLLVKNLDNDIRFNTRSGGNYYNNSLLSVPLKMRNRVIGVVNVNNKMSKDIFRQHDLQMLKTISDLAAVVIEALRLQDELEKNDKEYHELISNVTHDLKTPLATIKEAMLLMLEGVGGALTEKQHKYVEISSQNVDRMTRMIEDIIASDKALRERHSIKRSLFDVACAARSILSSLDILAKKKNILLKGAIPDKEIKIWGDPDKMNEVITNLVENAIKYNKPSGRVEVALEDGERSVTLSVIDTGLGIPKDDIGMIFDRYYRLKRDASADVPGTGLGLSIVKDIVKMHKGDISVESEPDKGTRFTVTLPKDLRA